MVEGEGHLDPGTPPLLQHHGQRQDKEDQDPWMRKGCHITTSCGGEGGCILLAPERLQPGTDKGCLQGARAVKPLFQRSDRRSCLRMLQQGSQLLRRGGFLQVQSLGPVTQNHFLQSSFLLIVEVP